MYSEPIWDSELAARCGELTESDAAEPWASELLEAGLIALMEAELSRSIPAALLAAELMDAGWAALGASELCDAELCASELARVKAPDACRPSRAPRRVRCDRA